jgi:ATP-dependent helicase IRC3
VSLLQLNKPFLLTLAYRLLRSAGWRKALASQSQRDFLAKRMSASHGSTNMATLTKGEAANIISRLKHGAKKRHEKKVKISSRDAKRDTKESIRRARESVQVGPLS